MDPATTSQPVILNRPDGSVIEFTRLSPSYRIRFRNAFRFARKVALYETLRLTGASTEETRKALNEFDARRLNERDVERWVDDPEGQREAVLLSLAMKSPALLDAEDKYAPVDAAGLDDREMHEVAAGVMGLRLVPVDDGEKKPDPTTDVTAPTGDATPFSSAGTSDLSQIP